MTTALTMKLEQFTRFTENERQRVDRLSRYPTERYRAGEVILAEGQRVDKVHLVLSGFAARSKTLPDGSRQIVAFMIPGDLCDLEVFVLEGMDHDVVAMTETACALIPVADVRLLLSESSTVTFALWWSTMTDTAVLRSRIVNQAGREAKERLANLFYELLIRYRLIGEASADAFPLPLTQQELADASGMTAVHLNRTLRYLRSKGLIEFGRGLVSVLDIPGLKKTASFESNYLHLARSRRKTDVSGRVADLM